LGVQKLTRPCLKITTESGRSIIVSRGHLFLCKHGLSDKGGGWRWRRADGLTVGSVLKPFPWEDHETDFDAGYVSGIFDGEGWLHSGRSRIGVAQKPGVVLDNFKRILLGNSIFWGHSTDKRKDVPVVNVTFDGHDCFKILQKFRPLRLLENCSWEGCGLPTNGHKHDRIVSIVDAGSREVVGLKTSTQTIIAEGLLSHNSFNAEVDKSKMAEVDLSKLIKYAGGDTDATFRLCKRLVSEVKQDKPQWRTVVKVQMPVLRMFFEMEERGICIDSNKLSSFGKELSDREEILYKELVDLVPRKVRQKHFSKGLSFSRADLIIDILFSEDGYGLCPKMFTKGSTEGSMKPSTDSKHLSNFPNNPFVQKFSEYQKIQKMRSTYVGERGGLAAKEISLLKSGKFPAKFARIVEEEPEELKHASNVDRVEVRMPDGKTIRLGLKTEIDPEAGGLAFHKGKWYAVKHVRDTGFWKHIMPDGKIHPSFLLHGTVTGRSSSRDPNSQNIPKRGPLAKPYRRMFVPTPGYVFLEADESQAELRVAAWMANDPTMIKIYREGGDIHRTTAARTARIKPEEVTSDMRQKAKAINFGFLYRMSANSFVDYAKYQYGVTFTLAEAKRVKADYFSLYSRLPDWHKRMSDLAHRDGFVRALHGAIRHLPSINSNEAMVVAEAERQAINSPIQRMASDISLLGLSQFAKGCDHKLMRPVAFIHDAGVVEVREDMALQGAAWLKWCMENPPLEELFGLRCPIPLVSDVTMGDNLGDMAEIKVTAEKPPWIV
jgi:DNA polymerase I-like protein with 3'-5' exonuclease and polymerase domains